MTASNSKRKTENSPLPPGMIVFVFLGLAMAVCATVGMTWPSDVPGEPFARLVAHWDRLLAVPPEGVEAAPLDGLESLAWTWRRVWDGLHYVLLLAGIGLAVWALLRDGPAPWVGLMVVGVLGFLYAAGMALYNGPLIAMPGYLLVFCGALLTALTWRRRESHHRGHGTHRENPIESL